MPTDISPPAGISPRDVPATDPREAGVLEAIDAIRPALQADGGDIVFSSIDLDGVVHVELVGACGTCPISTQTLKAGVQRIIMDRVPGITEVVAD
jgi:Fe-S cluster biogenesis protein NfuA